MVTLNRNPKKETMPTKTQKTERYLRCNLTENEVLEISRDCAQKVAERDRLEADKKRVTKDFDAQITACEAVISSASEKVRSGYEMRSVRCTVFFDQPVRGRKTIVRNDTDAVVETLDMTEADQAEADALV